VAQIRPAVQEVAPMAAAGGDRSGRLCAAGGRSMAARRRSVSSGAGSSDGLGRTGWAQRA
jgi:hypothetical protein